MEEIVRKYDELYGKGNWRIKKVSLMRAHNYPSLSVVLTNYNIEIGDYITVTTENDKIVLYIDKKELPPGTYKMRKVSISRPGCAAITINADLQKIGLKPGDYAVLAYLEDRVIIHKA